MRYLEWERDWTASSARLFSWYFYWFLLSTIHHVWFLTLFCLYQDFSVTLLELFNIIHFKNSKFQRVYFWEFKQLLLLLSYVSLYVYVAFPLSSKTLGTAFNCNHWNISNVTICPELSAKTQSVQCTSCHITGLTAFITGASTYITRLIHFELQPCQKIV